MRPVKIIHCSDFHFDTPFSELTGAVAEQRKEDLRETFGRVVELAACENADLLLVSGDFFDHQRVSRITINDLIERFRAIPKVRVFIAPGNHDPYHEKSYYHLVRWPENVHIFKGDMEKVELKELNTCVYGRGFNTSHQKESLLKGFTVEDPDKLNIMVLHGDLVSPGQESDYNPITPEEIKESSLDYLAMGHRHRITEPLKEGNTFWSYSGSPEGRGFDELGDKGLLFGELTKSSCRLNYLSICKRKYLEIKIDLSGCRTNEEIANRIISGAQGLEPEQNLFKIILDGELPEDFTLLTSLLKEKLRGVFYELKIVDKTKTLLDMKQLANDFSLKGLFVKNVLERLEDTEDPVEREKIQQSLKLGLQVLEQGKVIIQ